MKTISLLDILNFKTTVNTDFMVFKFSDTVTLYRHNKRVLALINQIREMTNTRYLGLIYDYRENVSETVYKLIDPVDNFLLFYAREDLQGNLSIRINRIYWLNYLATFKEKLLYLIECLKIKSRSGYFRDLGICFDFTN